MLRMFRRTGPEAEEVQEASRRHDRAHDDLREALHRLLAERNATIAEPQEMRS